MNKNGFNEAVVIITGASSGIGKATAIKLASHKAWLVLAARDKERLEDVAEQCRINGGKALVVPTDVSDEEQCKALIDHAITAYGRLDMLINNAAMGVGARLEELSTLSLFRRVIDVNLMGAIYCAYYSLPYLQKTRGRIVNIASIGGKIPIPGNSPYVTSKFGMIAFSDSLRMELYNSGVSVTVICPYWVITEFHERILDKDGIPAGESGRSIYTKKMMTADQFAPLVVKAALKRQRELTIWPGPLAVWLKMLAPGILDKITMNLFLKPALNRIEEGIIDK